LGQFSPALGLSREEIEAYGLPFNEDAFTRPFIADWVLARMFGEHADEVKATYLQHDHDDIWQMRPEYDTQAELTPSAVKIERENLKRFELENFSRYSIFELIENRSDFYDALLIQFWQEMGLSEQQGIALIAVGGYGRREMFPLSDLDFLIW